LSPPTNKTDSADSLAPLLDQLRVAPNDALAWRSLYRRLWPFIMAVCYRLLKNRAMAEDASQEVFSRLFHSRPFEKITDAGSFRAYLKVMTLNVARNHLRSIRQDERGEHALAEWQGANQLVGSIDPDGRLLFRETIELVQKDLDPEEARLLQLLLGGLSVTDVAEALGLSYSAAGVRVHRLRQKVRNILGYQGKKNSESL